MTVAEWLGITEEQFKKKVKYGTCVKCGKPARSETTCLCLGHRIAYHRWQNKKDGIVCKP